MMTAPSKCKALGVLCAVLLASSIVTAADASSPAAEITRVSATLNGVFSPRGFFNILVPLDNIQGVEAAKLDLKKSRITIDFSPGTPVTHAEIRQVMIDAGYRPGPLSIERIPKSQATESGPGWMKIKHSQSRHAFMRWLKRNF